MSGRTEIFLGLIAAATVVMAIVQVSVIIAAGLLARRVNRLVAYIEHELKPLFAHLNTIGRDGSRAASLAVAQVERADRLVGDLAQKIEQMLTTVQAALLTPAREGFAVLSALRAVMSALRDLRSHPGARPRRGDDEDALFI